MDSEGVGLSTDECRRWINKLRQMSASLQQKGDGDGARMFATAAVLVEGMAVQIQREGLMGEFFNPFGGILGEA
jgi:hypothetical protein